MRNKSTITALAAGVLILLFMIIFPIASKPHNSAFWSRYIITVFAMLIVALSILQVFRAAGGALMARGLFQTAFYAVAMFQTIVHMRTAHALIIYAVLFTVIYIVLFVTDPANSFGR